MRSTLPGAPLRGLWVLGLGLALSVGPGCERSVPPIPVDEVEYQTTLSNFRAWRVNEVAGEEGWSSLVGLFWLKPGPNRLGSDPSAEVRLPADRAPSHLATVFVEGASVRFVAAPGGTVTREGQPVQQTLLSSGGEAGPTTLVHGSLTVRLIQRGDRRALRIWDREHENRVSFAGLQYFPHDAALRIPGRFVPSSGPDSIEILNILGTTSWEPVPGVIEFELDGEPYQLRPILQGSDPDLFVMFKDETSQKETYPAGRYLRVSPPDSLGRVLVDFNRAYNPPCAFTEFATCPLPPPENRLPLRIAAGKLRPAAH